MALDFSTDETVTIHRSILRQRFCPIAVFLWAVAAGPGAIKNLHSEPTGDTVIAHGRRYHVAGGVLEVEPK